MKAIVSHDIDHLTVWEHKKDLIIPKFLVQSILSFVFSGSSLRECRSRFVRLWRNQWHNLEDLMRFDSYYGIPATFFVAVSSGHGLSYSLQDARFWIREILRNGFKVGVHGIAYDNLEKIQKEHTTFQQISGLNKFGVRMHYLNHDAQTLRYLEQSGYSYDTSIQQLKNPYRLGDLVEFPLHIMDVHYLMLEGSKFRPRPLARAKDKTKQLVEEVVNKDIDYLTVLFHDRYFSSSFTEWKEWYCWLIDYLFDQDIEFVNYSDALSDVLVN